ncbi:PDZ domain-containing protein [Paenibacillus sp. FJAT-26967]|uniref:PDZ domain-containing protein n=1 Tax=Paenibacillus sp. FJAT-26967 TaxID=1729690 RepID=UPI0008397F39|nr:PDZ domain-containing protein [Paenibacillus sp. FJAT-26967]
MGSSELGRTVNSVYIDGPVEKAWWYIATAEGWNHFLSDIATYSGTSPEISEGDEMTLVIGELTNRAVCTACIRLRLITFEEQYSSIFPDGTLWEYKLNTAFSFEHFNGLTKVTVTVDGFTEDEMMQWVKECTELGWRQSLFHLQNTIELGLDLRNSIFGYPRLGVLNYTASCGQLKEQNLTAAGLGGNYIKKVYPGGPAHRAGLPDGIIVTHLGKMPVPTYSEFVKALCRCAGSKETVELVYYKDGQRKTALVDLTCEDQFTGMVDPNAIPLEEVRKERKLRTDGYDL